GPRTQDEHLPSRHAACTANRMDSNRRRLDKCSAFQSEPRRQFQQGRFREREEFLGDSRGLKPHHLQVLANVITPLTARYALATDDLRGSRGQVARAEELDVAANFGNLPAEFVALNNRIGSVRMLAVINVNVRSADPNPADAQQHVLVAERGFRHFRELDFPWTCHGGAKHINPPRSAGLPRQVSKPSVNNTVHVYHIKSRRV